MRVVVMGGTGHVGRLVVDRLEQAAQAVVVAARRHGVDARTGHGLAAALEDADVVIDVTDSSHRDDRQGKDFFAESSRRLLEAERSAGVSHHVVLSIVGAELVHDDGYFAAKAEQERVVSTGGIPFTILRSTQFFEFARAIADWNTVEDTIHLPPTTVRPVAAVDVADALYEIARSCPLERAVEFGGPDPMPLPGFVGRVLLADHDPRFVVEDATRQTVGFNIESDKLLPSGEVQYGSTSLDAWISSGRTRSAVSV
ncbi:hypothetical protein CVS47_02813 [Microbacterium lemovicicum]|uniref:NAD(P)-binding domain-containing protein n=1 Tax=Microbacterium lemovicicum TaxID=1072463 RepID=A0A3S9WDP6_9MICO|nr:NAD(P)H-binding protein [Microbacterium lemovicicum]AZS38162.1 hypothetical protein CVS47_02813 [Microbacterium lemovicicum]